MRRPTSFDSLIRIAKIEPNENERMTDQLPKKIPTWPYGLLALMFALWLAGNLLWLQRNDHPFCPFILTQSYRFAASLADQGWAGWATRWVEENYYPPLYPALLGAFHHWLGVNRLNVALVTGLFILIGLPALYAFTRRLTERTWLALAGCAFFLLAPQIAFYSRAPLLEVPLAAMIPFVLWGLVASDDGQKVLPLLVAAVGFAAGMLLKWTFFPAVAGALLVFFLQAWLRHRRTVMPTRRQVRRRQIRNILLAVLTAFVLASPWYLKSLSLEQIAAQAPTDVTAGTPWSLAGWYLISLHREGLSPGMTHALILLLPFFFIGKKQPPCRLLLGTLMISYLVLFLIPHKNARYTPVLIPLAAMTVPYLMRRFLDWLPGDLRFLPPLLTGALVVVGGLHLSDLSFGRSVYPDNSGALLEQAPECLNDFETFFSRLESLLPPDANSVSVATHPFTVNSLSFNDDALSHAIALHNLERSPRLFGVGFSLGDYADFPERLAAVDFLLVQSDIWKLDERELQEKMSAVDLQSSTFNSVVSSADPLFHDFILWRFFLAEKVEMHCGSSLYIYQRFSSLPFEFE